MGIYLVWFGSDSCSGVVSLMLAVNSSSCYTVHLQLVNASDGGHIEV